MAKDKRARDSKGHLLHPKKPGRKKGAAAKSTAPKKGKRGRKGGKARVINPWDIGHVPLDILQKRHKRLTKIVHDREVKAGLA